MKLADNLKRLCKLRGITLSKLAKEAGVPSQTLHNWTIGRRSIDPEQVKEVAKCLEVSMYELMFDEDDPYQMNSGEILSEIFSGDVRVTLHRIKKK